MKPQPRIEEPEEKAYNFDYLMDCVNNNIGGQGQIPATPEYNAADDLKRQY